MDLQRGHVVWLLPNHLSRQAVWKKCLQDTNSLTSSISLNPHRHTQHSIPSLSFLLPLFFSQRDSKCVMEILLLLLSESSWSESSSIFLASSVSESEPITWRTDLTMFFNKDTETTVFITSSGTTPSDAVG